MKVAAAKPDGCHPARLNIPDWTDCVISGIRELVSLYSLIGVLILLPVCAAAQAPTKRVLILSGSDPNYPGFSIITRNIVSILGGSGTRVELLYELQLGLLDLPESPASDEELAGYLKRKYADKKLDLIVSIVAPRMRILLLKDPWLFGNVPKIFYESESEREDTNRSLGPNITGVWANIDLNKTLELALALHPDTRKVVVVSGNGPEDNLRRERAQAEFHKYEKRAEFSYIRGNTIEELKAELAALDKRSVVIFLTFTRDKAGNRYSGPETISMIAYASNAPIYGYSGNLMGLGLTGGNLLDFEGIGGRIGEMSRRVLAGERAEQIPQETAPTVMTVDWRELQRWGIDERNLPPGTVVRFRQPSFWELYKWYIIGLVAACVVEALLIAWLLINRSRRRRAEEANDKLAAIVESSDDAILSKTPEGIITSWNAGAETMYGYTASEIVGQHVTTLAPTELRTEVAGILEKIQRGESVDHLETVRVTKDGRRIDVSLTISPIKDEHMMIIAASTIARDITARKKAEAEATEQRAELAHLSRVTMLGELSGSLAHELNQPLGAILRNTEAAELFLQEPSPDLEELRAILADIHKDDERAGAVIDRMRALVKRREIEHSLLDLNVLASEVISLVRPDADSRKVRLALEPASSLPPVRGDRVQLQQVLLNLLLNAIHAVDDSATDRRRVTVRVKPAGTRVDVAVSDTGHGIPSDELARLFEPFFTTKPNGMGMGLPISRTIMQAHLGSIQAENDPEGGATFCFSLPVAKEGSAP